VGQIIHLFDLMRVLMGEPFHSGGEVCVSFSFISHRFLGRINKAALNLTCEKTQDSDREPANNGF
jgi:hypothetical protein